MGEGDGFRATHDNRNEFYKVLNNSMALLDHHKVMGNRNSQLKIVNSIYNKTWWVFDTDDKEIIEQHLASARTKLTEINKFNLKQANLQMKKTSLSFEFDIEADLAEKHLMKALGEHGLLVPTSAGATNTLSVKDRVKQLQNKIGGS